jgi:hypothetical protein
MFIKLTHGLHAVLNAIVSYIQKWTDDSVPDGTRTLHNFKDGQGKRPAVPLDELTNGNNIVNVKTDSKFEHGSDDVTSSENILKVELKTELGYGDDNLASKTGIESTVCVPEPVIFEISNEVPDKIEKVIPIKTQALPGQDFVFQILYVKDYNYIEGDILPVFGSWGNYARISRDGKYLTVNSNADLSVRLILTPAPQDWIPEQPDPSIIQQQGDRMLNTIPRDGAKADYTIEEMKIEDNFYTVSIENQATTFVTNGEFSNGKYYNVGASTNKITIPMTFAEGFDENAVYWKCYDDPKSENPVTGYYPTKDYNEEFGPLPSGFRKLQYIYPNNGAYIDLGIKLKKDYKVKVLMNVSNQTDVGTRALFGARNSTSTEFYYDNNTAGAYACYTRYAGYSTIGFQRNTHRYSPFNSISHYGSIKWYYSNGTLFEVQNYDGTLYSRTTANVSDNIDTDWNCYLFTVNDKGTPFAYGASGNLYRFEMWDENDNLLMRLIPAKNLATGSCGLYDIINDKFYYNQRLGASFGGPEFYVWQKPIQCSDHNVTMYLENNDDIDYNADYDIPTEYQKVYEIYSKERRLDTGYKIKKDDRVECCATVDNNTNSSYRVLFGSRQSSFSDDNYFFFTRFNSSNVACYGKNAKETRGTTMTYGKPCKFVAEPYSLSCYNIEGNLEWKIDVDGGTPVDCRYNCWLGCGNNNGSIDSWCYAHYHYFRVYDKDDNLVVNMIPARRLSDGVLGFYDTVRNKFYTSDSGNYNYEYKNLYKGAKRILHIENIHKDINLGIIRNPVYDNPFKLEDCIEDEIQNEPKDSLTYTYEITDSKILDYFYVVSTTNNATDYVSVDASYKTANLGNNASFTLTYKTGYDNYDIKGIPNTTANVEITKALYITYNELDIPPEYTPVKGLYTENSNTYFKTGYVPEWEDKVVCYCSIRRDNWPTYPCYVFGARNDVNNKSFVFYAHRSGNNYYNTGYDRCSGETQVRDNINNELLKITGDKNTCEVDYGYTKTKINTTAPLNVKYDFRDYNSDVTLPNNYIKQSCLMKKQQSKAYIDLGMIIKSNYKMEAVVFANSESKKSNVILFGSTSNESTAIAEKTSTQFTYPMRYNYSNNCWVNTNQNRDGTSSELEFKMLISGSLTLNVTQYSEQNYDYLVILKNGSQITSTQGLYGARTIQLSDLSVNDIIKIYYRKDGSVSRDSDTATVQILYNNNIVNDEFIVGTDTKSNILYTKYSGNNVIALKQQNLVTNNQFIYNDTVKIKMDGTKISWWNSDGELIAEMPYSSSDSEPIYNTYLFGVNSNGVYKNYNGIAKLYIYSFKLYDENDNLIYHFVPAQNKISKEYGLYDIVTDTFFTNAGEDSFDGHDIQDEVYYGGYDCEYEMYVFGCNSSNSRQYGYYGNMYKFTIYDYKNKPVVNFVPVKRISDSVLGFYDTVAQKFITPAGGSVSESTAPTYKSAIVVSNIPDDTYVTITKNDNARKNIYLEEGIEDDVFHQQIDQLEHTYELKNTEIIDWFNTVKYINNASLRCSIAGAVATYYNVPRIGADTRFPVTYNIGVDDDMIEATATAGATVEITKPIKIVYNHVPDEYITLYGLYNNDSNTYFEIPYNIKATDSVKVWVSDTKNSYTYYIFGSATNETTNSCLLCSRYENYNNNMYYSRNKRVNISGPANEVLEITCEPSNINYTNGYDDYNYDLDNTPTDCIYPFHVFGAYHRGWYGNHAPAFTGTIYKLTVYDTNGIKINLVPVKRKADGALGFYDTVQDQFYLPGAGSVSIAPAPKLKGRIIVSNITDDTDLIVTEKTQPTTNIEETDAISYSYNIEGCSISDYWNWINVNNTTNGEVTFTNMTYSTCYTCIHGNDITLPCTYKAGRSSTDFIVSEGTLTNNGLVLTNVTSDKNITVMLNDYHDPKSDTNDDLNIFTDPDFSGYNQYRVVNGTDLMLTSYTYINSQIAAMTNKQIFEFNVGELDILAFDPANIPGDHIKARIVTSDSNLTEVVQNVTIDGKQMYKHTVTLRNQIKLENGKVYMFKVRDNTDTGKLIAYAKDTGPLNLVNSNGEYTIEDGDVYFNWNEANKYIVQGNKTIYFELNGIKL